MTNEHKYSWMENWTGCHYVYDIIQCLGAEYHVILGRGTYYVTHGNGNASDIINVYKNTKKTDIQNFIST